MTQAGNTARPARRSQPTAAQETEELLECLETQEKLNRELRTYISEITIVFRFIETLSTLHEMNRILDLLMNVLKELCEYDSAVLYLYTTGDLRSEQIPRLAYREEEVHYYRKKLALDEDFYQQVYHQGHALIVPERLVLHDGRQEKNWSYLVAPLATTTERIGRIEMVFKHSRDTFKMQTLDILNVLLKHAGVILLNERVYAKERETSQKYIELDRLKKDVVNTTTHEIKTPLTIIQAAGILLKRHQRMPRLEQKQLLTKIIHQCGRINQIVNELFETAQVDGPESRHHPEVISLPQLTEAAMQDIHYDVDLIQFRFCFPADLRAIKADRSSLHKALRNLIENAVKYSPEGGEIEISAGNQGRQVQWQIRDQGVGISSEDQRQIFNKFFRAGTSRTRAIRGMGFGLYLVKKNVELNQGTICVQSKPQAGSVFRLEFPAHFSRG